MSRASASAGFGGVARRDGSSPGTNRRQDRDSEAQFFKKEEKIDRIVHFGLKKDAGIPQARKARAIRERNSRLVEPRQLESCIPARAFHAAGIADEIASFRSAALFHQFLEPLAGAGKRRKKPRIRRRLQTDKWSGIALRHTVLLRIGLP